jgi:thiamine transporter
LTHVKKSLATFQKGDIMSSKVNVRLLAEIAIVAALAMLLSLIPLSISWFEISLGTPLVILVALRRGPVVGVLTGLVWGLLHFVLGRVYFLSIPQVLIEYVLAFSFAGLAGLMFKPFAKTGKANLLVTAVLIGTFAKYFWHFIAGVIFWSDYAWKGWGAVAYSLVINGVSFILTAIFGIIVLLVLQKAAPQLFKV